ncbi:SDR family NAD(P)-dependent oxidoreductase [Streptomyces sodiiphilus]|uniref:SDR family NAD(P)-dependent oxidoreductase n=1 Tax=Streptomyces sodiiphilus TaxID=226217 RepID=A0ABP5A3U7_9ACTN
MKLQDLRVVVTGASRKYIRALAIGFAHLGAEVYVSARTEQAAEKARDEVVGSARGRLHTFGCDLSRPQEIREFARRVGDRTDRVDLLVNSGARWLEGTGFESASDERIVETIGSTASGTVLVVKHFLPLLKVSPRPDIVHMIPVGEDARQTLAHEAFHAARSAQTGFADVLARRLKPFDLRVFSFHPPDFSAAAPLHAGSDGDAAVRAPGEPTTQALFECIVYAIEQPRDCFVRSFHFEPR